MKFDSFDDEDDGEYNGTDFVEIFKITAMYDAFFFRTGLFDKVQTAADIQLVGLTGIIVMSIKNHLPQ